MSKSLTDRIENLERKLCCKTRYFNTFEDFPTTGIKKTLYVDNSTGSIYIWDGSQYVTASSEVTAKNGLRVDENNFVIKGSDSATDSKGSQFATNIFNHLNAKEETWVGNNGSDTFQLKITKEGNIRQTSENKTGSTTSNKFMSVQALSDKAIGFNFQNSTTYLSTPNTNNDVFMLGWNLNGGGGAEVAGKTGIGMSFENHFEPATGYDLAEMHDFFIDKAGVQHRLMSYTIDKDSPPSWEQYKTLGRYYHKHPTNNNKYFEVNANTGGDTYFTLLGANESETKSVQFTFSATQGGLYVNGNGLDSNKYNNLFLLSGFGSIQTEAFNITAYPSVVVFTFSAPLPSYVDNAAAIIGGVSINGLYKTPTGEVRIRI